VEREIRGLVQAIKDVVSALSIKNELMSLEARQAELKQHLEAPKMPPLLHLRMADVYREKVRTLCHALEHEDSRAGAADAIRGLIEATSPPNKSWLRGRPRQRGAVGAVVAREKKFKSRSRNQMKKGAARRCHAALKFWLRGRDLNPRPLGYEHLETRDPTNVSGLCQPTLPAVFADPFSARNVPSCESDDRGYYGCAKSGR
jgi:hypothetical protein